jgi:predicted pyridoxine 5'-phosphate oxidase superfamily flavin-nucleotide-binding protein
MPIHMTELHARFLAQAFDDEAAPLVGTASKDGDPQISPKGTVAVLDSETLCFWERSYRSSYHALEENPRILVYCRNPKRAKELPFRNGALRFAALHAWRRTRRRGGASGICRPRRSRGATPSGKASRSSSAST